MAPHRGVTVLLLCLALLSLTVVDTVPLSAGSGLGAVTASCGRCLFCFAVGGGVLWGVLGVRFCAGEKAVGEPLYAVLMLRCAMLRYVEICCVVLQRVQCCV